MSKNGHVGPYIHTHQNVYFIQKKVNLQFVLITNFSKLGLLPRFLQKINNKAIYDHFFIPKTSDASHP